jgi:hypothetical protein
MKKPARMVRTGLSAKPQRFRAALVPQAKPVKHPPALNVLHHSHSAWTIKNAIGKTPMQMRTDATAQHDSSDQNTNDQSR